MLGSDNVDLDEEQGALRQTPKRRRLVDELRRMLVADGWEAIGVADGWEEIGVADGGEWYDGR